MSGSGSFVCSRIWNATLSKVDMSVNSAPNWNSMLIRRRISNSSSAFSRLTSCPNTRTAPFVARSAPPISLSSVVLPHPLPPMIATTLPRGMTRLMPDRTSRVSS